MNRPPLLSTLILRNRAKFGAPIVAALMAYVATTTQPTGLALWADASGAIVQTISITGPMFGALAAWNSIPTARQEIADQWRTSPDDGSRASLSMLLSSLIWAWSTYLVGVSIVLIETSLSATWGQPNWVWLLGGALSLGLHVILGHVFGQLIPLFLTPAFVALGLFVANATVFLAGGSSRLAFLSPGYAQTQQVAFSVNTEILWAQIGWFLGLAMVVVGVSSLRFRSRRSLAAAICVPGIVLSFLGFSGIQASANGFFIYSHAEWKYSCTGVPQVCIHPAYEKTHEQINEALSPVIESTADTPFGTLRYEWTNRGYLGQPSLGAQAFHLDRLGPFWKENLRAELARDLLTPGSQSGGPCEITKTENDLSAYDGLGTIVAAWIAGEVELESLRSPAEIDSANWFHALNDEKKKAWVTANLATICSGQLQATNFK